MEELERSKQVGLRYLVTCKKCGYQWLAQKPNPKYCALCANPHPEEERKYKKS